MAKHPQANIRIFPSIRKTPQNIEGQYTNNDGLRYYPTLWIIAGIEFIDFEYVTKYSPHISLACVAVQLNVNNVAKFEINQFDNNDTNCDNSN